jgi:hypothetical protein
VQREQYANFQVYRIPVSMEDVKSFFMSDEIKGTATAVGCPSRD